MKSKIIDYTLFLAIVLLIWLIFSGCSCNNTMYSGDKQLLELEKELMRPIGTDSLLDKYGDLYGNMFNDIADYGYLYCGIDTSLTLKAEKIQAELDDITDFTAAKYDYNNKYLPYSYKLPSKIVPDGVNSMVNKFDNVINEINVYLWILLISILIVVILAVAILIFVIRIIKRL